MTADVELLPCPFCGSAEPIVAEPPEILPLSFQIICSGSGCNAVVESRTLARAKLMWNRRANVAQQQGQAVATNSAVAAIQFALKDPEGMTFLRLWNEGEFDTLRREWPDAPVEVYTDADPLAAQQGDRDDG